MSPTVNVRARLPGDADWSTRALSASWGSPLVVTRGRLHDAGALPALVATIENVPSGLLTYRIEGGEMEIVTLDSLRAGRGVGSALITESVDLARRIGCGRVWLITTNDNLHALRFYQKRGFRLVAVHPDALAASRRLKPAIPLTGIDGIPLRDEIELERAP